MLLAMPSGQERRARRFYVDVLGFTEVIRPEVFGGRGGGWFRSGPVMLHLGVDENFVAARVPHPAIIVADLSALRGRCEAGGHPVEPALKLPGFQRFHVYDPFGNRLEFMQAEHAPSARGSI